MAGIRKDNRLELECKIREGIFVSIIRLDLKVCRASGRIEQTRVSTEKAARLMFHNYPVGPTPATRMAKFPTPSQFENTEAVSDKLMYEVIIR